MWRVGLLQKIMTTQCTYMNGISVLNFECQYHSLNITLKFTNMRFSKSKSRRIKYENIRSVYKMNLEENRCQKGYLGCTLNIFSIFLLREFYWDVICLDISFILHYIWFCIHRIEMCLLHDVHNALSFKMMCWC